MSGSVTQQSKQNDEGTHLNIAQHVLLHGRKGNRAQQVFSLAKSVHGFHLHHRGEHHGVWGKLPNMVVSDSTASRNSAVEMALVVPSTGTLVKVALKVSM